MDKLSLRNAAIKLGGGQHKINCPSCESQRKKKNQKTLSIKIEMDSIMYQCWHCQQSGVISIEDRTPPATHDVILENPATGQKSIYLDPNKTLGIDGLSQDESKELIDAVSQHMLQDDLIYTHTWRNGDVVMWDNARLWHRREAFDASLPRFARRTTIFLRPDDFAVPEPGLT